MNTRPISAKKVRLIEARLTVNPRSAKRVTSKLIRLLCRSNTTNAASTTSPAPIGVSTEALSR